MGTFIEQTRKEDSAAFSVLIIFKKGAAIVRREKQAFGHGPAANAWIVRREADLKSPGLHEAWAKTR